MRGKTQEEHKAVYREVWREGGDIHDFAARDGIALQTARYLMTRWADTSKQSKQRLPYIPGVCDTPPAGAGQGSDADHPLPCPAPAVSEDGKEVYDSEQMGKVQPT